MARKRRKIPEERKQKLQNVRIGGKLVGKKKKKKEVPSKVAPVIKLEPKKKEKLTGKEIVKRLFKPQIPEDMELIAGTVPIGPAGAVAAAKATVTATVAAHRLITTSAGAEKLIGIGTRMATRSFIGKPAIPKAILKLFKAARPEAVRFATNTKTLSLTEKMLSFAKSPTGIMGAILSYPFSMFIKEEAIQTIGMGFWQASQNNDLAGMEAALQEQADILDPGTWEKLISLVPYANTVKQLKDFFKTAIVKMQIDRGIFEKAKLEAAGQETQFQRERRESDEAARERIIAYRAEDEEYYADIEAQRQEDKEKGREEDSEYYRKIAEENRARKLKEREEDEAYYAQFT